jgi:hypothetical protein
MICSTTPTYTIKASFHKPCMRMNTQLLQRIKNRYILHRYLEPFCRYQLAHRSYSPQNTIALFAQPRSGSTWLAQLLHQIPKSIILNEPLWRGHLQTHGVVPGKDEGKLDEVRALGFYYYQPIPEKAEWPEAKLFFDTLFRGGICKLGLYKLNRFHTLAGSEVFVVKFCYAHLLFHWLLTHFPIKPLVLMRHPCAVVSSQLQHHAWDIFRRHPSFKLASFPYHSYLLQYQDILKHIHTPEGILAAFWAINTLAIQQPHAHTTSWYTLSYEKLYLNGPEELDQLFKWLEHPIPHSINESFGRPSISTSAASRQLLQEHAPLKHLGQWKENLSRRQISNIMQIVQDFGINYYSADSLEPDYVKLSALA